MNRTVTRIIIALLAITGVVRYVHERAVMRDALDKIAYDRVALIANSPGKPPRKKTDGFSLIVCAFLLACLVFLASAVITWMGGH